MWESSSLSSGHSSADPGRSPICSASDKPRCHRRRALQSTIQRPGPMFTGVTEYAVYTLDLQGCVTTWNAAAERLHGYRTEDILGQHFRCFYPEADRDAGVPDD